MNPVILTLLLPSTREDELRVSKVLDLATPKLFVGFRFLFQNRCMTAFTLCETILIQRAVIRENVPERS